MNGKELNWRHLKGLYQLYQEGKTAAKITDNDYIRNFLMGQKSLMRYKKGNTKVLEAAPHFTSYYRQYFKTSFEHYQKFLQQEGLEDDGRRKYTEEDIQTLIFIAEQKQELKEKLTTIRTFSSKFFKKKGSKYLENKPGLLDAVCRILEIPAFPEKDPQNLQWRFVVDCEHPEKVILCENIAHLKSPWKAREHNLELWYVGGNNIGIIDYIGEEKLSKPVYYSCDWDYHGLSIYSRIRRKLQSKGVSVVLLQPYRRDVALPVDSPHHNSKWNFDQKLSGLDPSDFTEEEQELILWLIKNNEWIEEESLELIGFFTMQQKKDNAG